MERELLLYCVKYLHRHPSEVDLTIDQMSEVAVVADELFEIEKQMMGGQ